ncbi:HEAT repeat domain-containing protein [Nocardioides pocheonensis]|uniref:HEAT repeat domain-containing protein n=1 Tax=Nocardioides pocheonensis TaxID=661485 RepID=A0A3N0GJB8_9ACTN|nr:HEAT repeat domain-containing protein [Nocardioides pocheonensis]RNM12140.1 HEAT repeat domain-containing protein [Nocardioides pocheonensis]
MSLFTRRHRIEQLAALGDVTGLREAMLAAARAGAADELCVAASALVDLGEAGITALLEAILDDPDHAHFGRIEDETFHRAASPRAVALLADALECHPDGQVRLVASDLLRRLDTALADEAFAAGVTDRDPHVRLSAARGLADHGDARGVRALLEWVAHSDDPLPALAGLARLGDPAVVPALQQVLASARTPYVAAAIARTVAEIEAHPAPPSQPLDRLARLRDRIRSIELVDRRPRPTGPDVERALQQVAAIDANLATAMEVLRTGSTSLGRPVTKAQVGIGLASLAAAVSGDEVDRSMSAILQPRGVRALRAVVVDLDVIASELQERGASAPSAEE